MREDPNLTRQLWAILIIVVSLFVAIAATAVYLLWRF